MPIGREKDSFWGGRGREHINFENITLIYNTYVDYVVRTKKCLKNVVPRTFSFILHH